ncbi:hypothetical protein BGX38DRAFT_1182283 [Terfezia claveryi]|nr:hypothetical protein BGX38DRAFT_1182283 [Terfezia claveryi]
MIASQLVVPAPLPAISFALHPPPCLPSPVPPFLPTVCTCSLLSPPTTLFLSLLPHDRPSTSLTPPSDSQTSSTPASISPLLMPVPS